MGVSILVTLLEERYAGLPKFRPTDPRVGMNYSRYLSDSRRSPYPRRRRRLEPRSPELAKSLPAITLLAPDGYHLGQTMVPRPLSPGAFRMAPPRSAKNKITSFVILNENIMSPISSRPSSPSGRVSPFRGHGFKSPTTSRPTSKAVTPIPSPTRRKSVVPVDRIQVVHADIGLPPKSPKKVLKNVQIKEYKPALKPKPLLINGNKIGVKSNGVGQKQVKVVSAKKTVIMPTAENKKDKKLLVSPKRSSKLKTENVVVQGGEREEITLLNTISPTPVLPVEVNSDDPIVISKAKVVEIDKPNVAEEKKEDADVPLIPCFQPDKCFNVPPTMASPSLPLTSTTTVPSVVSTTNRVSSSSLSAITSAISVTDTLKTNSIAKADKSKPPSKEDVKLISTPIVATSPAHVEQAVATVITVDEMIKSRVDSASSQKSVTRLSLASPTLSEKTRSSMVTVRAASTGSLHSNGAQKLEIQQKNDVGETISSTKLIRVDPDVEVLSPNNLLRSPLLNNIREPEQGTDEIPNGNAQNPIQPKGRRRRFTAALWRLITYLFCCCKKWPCSLPTCCRSGCWERCRRTSCRRCCQGTPSEATSTQCCRQCCNPCSFFKRCFNKLNCCKNLQCSSCCKQGCCQSNCCKKPLCKGCSSCCGKVKCCKGKKCCQQTKHSKSSTSSSTMCCAKPNCSCKECCVNLKVCCRNCNDQVNNCCRSLFCLNLMCCQRCLKKCTKCHRLKCCKKGGCCSCCNPNVKREQKQKLDKKNSRASNQSKQERAQLDSALVEHTSVMKAAIPVLPACLAWLCLILNFGIPGSGTLLSGILCLCFGKPRFSTKDSPQNRCSSFLVNVVIAIAQAFTIIFCLVGWGWSMWWGVIMVKLARKQKRLALAEKNQDGRPAAVNDNHVDPGRMV